MNLSRLAPVVALVGLVLAACGDAGGDEERGNGPTTSTTTPTTTTTTTDSAAAPGDDDPSIPPDVDMSIHSVPLEEIYFDTFDGGSVPLSESTPELRARLLDAIPPIDEPVYGGPEDGDWLLPGDPVVGYVAGDQAYAYPFKILNFHEIVNDTLDGTPVLISYCPLCRSAIVYDRRVDGEVLSFGNTSALYENDLVMVDRDTGSYWWQVPGKAIVGPLTGSELTPLPSSVFTWQDWKEKHPDTLILTRDTGYAIQYERDPFANYESFLDNGQFPFPVGEEARDPRLDPSDLVVGVQIGGVTKAYPVETLDGALNDEVGGEPIVLFAVDGGASVFSPVVDGEPLEFVAENGDILDTTTGSRWSVTGEAVSGPLEGTRLEPLPSRTTFWFAMVGAFPDLTLVTG